MGLLLAGAVLVAGCAPVTQAPAATALSAQPATPTPMTPAGTPTLRLTPTGVASIAPAATSPAGPATAGSPENGAKVFASHTCSSCHDITKPYPGGDICPNLGNIGTEAARIVKSPDYHGKATDAAGYIRESIVDPNAYLVPGDRYHTPDGQSVMPKDFGQVLSPSELDDLVAFLVLKK